MSAFAYYNEIDPFCADWLENLIAENLITPGEVDRRDIRGVAPVDLEGYSQHHFFAGIGGWSLALRQAGWPDDEPVWTGSCPCQPFSGAGKREGFADERHLWPFWHHLIRIHGPAVVFGEQVAGKNGYAWLSLVQADMEAYDYAFGATDICAAGFGAPHKRSRLYFVAESLGHCIGAGLQKRIGNGRIQHEALEPSKRQAPVGGSDSGELADDNAKRRKRLSREGEEGASQYGLSQPEPFAGALDGFWKAADWLFCTDGKWRPVEPGTFTLADGIPKRVGKLRAYGNAIVIPQARAFIESYIESRS